MTSETQQPSAASPSAPHHQGLHRRLHKGLAATFGPLTSPAAIAALTSLTGFASIIVGTYLVASLGWALIVAAVPLLALGWILIKGADTDGE